MVTALILIALSLIVYFFTRKKAVGEIELQQGNNFQSKIDKFYFPDRIDSIARHVSAINTGLKDGDLELVNLSYAKLIESIRQQNKNERGKYEAALNTIKDEYSKFRKIYGLDYPQQFLPPEERTRKLSTSKSVELSINNKNDLTSYIIIDNKAITDIHALFSSAGNSEGLNREFWITDDGNAKLLAKILSIYSFSINIQNIDVLVNKANRFIKQMRKEAPHYWNEFPLYQVADVQESYPLNIKTDIIQKLKSLSVGERLYFFDFAFGNYWTGQSSYRTRTIGVDEKQALNNFVRIGLFSASNDLESVLDIVGKRELKEFADKMKFELKKSWTVEKMFGHAMTTEQGRDFLNNFLNTKQIWKFNSKYKEDLESIVTNQTKIKLIADLICVV